jgi:hypothetical protein
MQYTLAVDRVKHNDIMHTNTDSAFCCVLLLILCILLQTAFTQGEEADAMGIVVSGRIDVKMRRVDNNSTTVATLTEVVYKQRTAFMHNSV